MHILPRGAPRSSPLVVPSIDLAPHLSYWKSALAGYEEGLALPYDHARPPTRVWQARLVRHRYPEALAEKLTRFSQKQGGTLFMTLLSALLVVLNRYTGRTDLCIGTTVAGRDFLQLEDLIGFFVNILPLRMDLSGDPSGQEIVQRVKKVALEGYEHQALPFEHLLNALQLQRDNSQVPLAPITARHQNFPEVPVQNWAGGLEAQEAHLSGSYQTAKCELDFAFFGSGTNLDAVVEYAADLFKPATIERLLRHHEQVLGQLVAEPALPLSQFTVITPAERGFILEAWNATDRPYDESLSVPALFERQVQRHPEKIACVSEEGERSYAELNARANQVAHALRAQGVGPEVRVGLYLERSLDFLVGLLGIFKAGGAYVPLDPAYPLAYLQLILADARPKVVVTKEALGPRLSEYKVIRLNLEAVAEQPTDNPAPVLRPEHLAHINYTSGSTGRPKGVMVAHRQILNWLQAMWQRMPFGPDEMVAQKTVAAFSISVKELLAGLLSGTPQVLIPDETVKGAGAFAQALSRWKVTRLNIVPSHLQALLASENPTAMASLKHCIISGEALTQTLRAEVKAKLPWVQVWNVYGCTELNDTTYSHPDEQEGGSGFAPIGRPIANTKVFILDAHLRP